MVCIDFNNVCDAGTLTVLFETLKDYFEVASLENEKRDYIIQTVQKYGYLPISFQECLEKVSIAEVLVGIEEKLKLNGVFDSNKFVHTEKEISPVSRFGYNDSSWLSKEQLNIKLLNLAALGNGKKDELKVGKFCDWLKQLLILPSGNKEFGVLGTVMYFVPFHPRDFGCAYLPTSKFISEVLSDSSLERDLNLNLSGQVKLYFTLCQLCGHPLMYDVLPQTGRFSKTILEKPEMARWFNVKELNIALRSKLKLISTSFKHNHDRFLVEKAFDIIDKTFDGIYDDVADDISLLKIEMEKCLDYSRKRLSNNITSKDQQEKYIEKIQELICTELDIDRSVDLTEELIGDKQGDLISKLTKEGFWPAPGGAWNSAGVPVYERMAQNNDYPIFKHYDVDGHDVTFFANLDCQTPFYFVYLENGEYNQKVIDFWCKFLIDLQEEYSFDAYRVDHIDHIVDRVSQDVNGNPISYRVPSIVLGEAISRIREIKPHFGALAEYMLWDNYYKEYHQDMNFNVLWGDDIISQFAKNVKEVIRNSSVLAEYNSTLPNNKSKLAILKTYNNQDGEFREIDQYPAQMGEEGALFKWFKLKFTPLGQSAERPVLYVDGDESYTEKGTEKVIGSEIALKRNNKHGFFRKFDAINRFALKNHLCRYGISEIIDVSDNGSGFVSWTIKNADVNQDSSRLFIVANENPPRQYLRKEVARDQLRSVLHEYDPIYNTIVTIPDGFDIVEEYILPPNGLEYVASQPIGMIEGKVLRLEILKPSEFHIYLIRRN